MTAADRARRYVAAVPGATKGGRDRCAFGLACRLVERFDLDDADLLPLLAEWNRRCDPPLAERTLRTKLASARRTTAYDPALANGEPARQADRPRPEPEPPAAPLPDEAELADANRKLTGGGQAAEARAWLAARGIDPAACGWGIARLTAADLPRYQLPQTAEGVRLLVPVRAADGYLLDVRRYAAGPLGRDVAADAKLLPWATGHGSAKPYGWHQLSADADPIVWCEGEADRETLRAAGLAVVTNTCGAGSAALVARERLPAELVTGRRFVVLFDRDAAGDAGAARLAQALLARGAAEVRVATWPVDARDGYDAGDWYADGADLERLRAVLDAAVAVTAEQGEEAEQRQAFCRPGVHRCDDIGNAGRLVELFGDRLRYCPDWRTWLVWDGTRWAIDVEARAVEYAKTTARSILREAHAAPEEQRSTIAKWAIQSGNRARLEALLALAQSDPALVVLSTALDTNPWLLNTPTGTVDLLTGQLREHRQADLITMRTNAAFVPGADEADTPEAELFRRFMADTTNGDEELQRYICRAFGYSLTGSTREEVFFFPYGPTRTGKSTLLETVGQALGDYSESADFEAFLQTRDIDGEKPSPQIARLQGKRFVRSIESARGRTFAEALLKKLTGGDEIAPRALHKAPVTWRATFKLWFASNEQPRIRHDDAASWRRVRVLPFEHQLADPDDPTPRAGLPQPDLTLKERLQTDALEVVLAWAVRGCLDWQTDGLGTCEAVRVAVREYRDSQDPLGGWLADCCEVDTANAALVAPARQLYQSYVAWANDSGLTKPLSEKTFALQMKARGFEQERIPTATEGNSRAFIRVYYGIRAVSDPGDPGDPAESGTFPRESLNREFRTDPDHPDHPDHDDPFAEDFVPP